VRARLLLLLLRLLPVRGAIPVRSSLRWKPDLCLCLCEEQPL